MTGFPNHVRQLIRQRADDRCEVCGKYSSDSQIHHRRARGAGGSKRDDTNTASNGLLVDFMCHSRIESYRAQAYDNGWLVRSGGSPIATPVLYRDRLVLLDDDGFVYPIPRRGEAAEA